MVQTVDESEGIHDADMQAEGNQDAARALLRVKQKLDGYEEGEMRSLQGQVKKRGCLHVQKAKHRRRRTVGIWEYAKTLELTKEWTWAVVVEGN